MSVDSYRLKEANQLFAKYDYGNAIVAYFKILHEYDELVGLIVPNIIRSKNELNKRRNTDLCILGGEFIFQDGWISFTESSKEGNHLVTTTNEIDVVKTLGLKIFQYEENRLPEDVLYLVLKNPTKNIDIYGQCPISLLIGLMYRLVLDARVNVYTSRDSMPQRIEEHFEYFANPAQLAICFTGMPAGVGVFINLSRANKAGNKIQSGLHLSNEFNFLGKIYDELTIPDDDLFVRKVFFLTLGRAPQSHEIDHYIGQLKDHNFSRNQIALIISMSTECRTYIQDHHKPKKKLIYALPMMGDISPERIVLPEHSDPLVSILIPVYGKIEYTIACIDSIARTSEAISFEILVLDDRSLDETLLQIKKIKGIRVIENPENLGFLRSCNFGAKHAKGKYLYFLNNDTIVKPGWLDNLVKTFDIFKEVGLVGSKLVYPDGSLQEAGGILWNDGSAWNYGNKQDPSLPQFNYARDADYISGASIMLPSKLFHELGGFDELYAPAYYEDTDIAMRVRARGLRVIYQPLSEVVHFEGVSSGTDISTGTKAYQVTNRTKFFKRWEQELQVHRPNGLKPHLERDRCAKGRVLFIDACTPTPDQDSGSVDIFNLLRVFVEMSWAVTFIPEDNYAFMEKYTSALQKIGVQALYYPHIKSVDDHITEHGDSYDLVMSFRPLVTQKHLSNLRQKCPRARIVFNTVDLHFLRLEREAALKNDPDIKKEAQELKLIEINLMKMADLTTVVSSSELELLKKMGIERVRHLPFSREIRSISSPYEARSDLLFVGGFQHNPNVDAVKYFVADIMPLLRVMIPGVILNIVGSNAPQEICELNCEDVVVHGFLENLEGLMDVTRINVAPLRYGAGTKGKVVHALANGLPTVATSIAVEGMGLKNMEDVAVGDDPQVFAELVKILYFDKNLWNKFAINGATSCHKLYGFDSLRDKVLTLI